jgi:SAM-dependent methyltransferase
MIQAAARPASSSKSIGRPVRDALAADSPLNRYSPALDPLSFRFAMWAGQATAPCLDVGCGSGVAVKAALARGARVIAVDPDVNVLHELLTQLPVNQFGRISVNPAHLQELECPAGLLAAVHISRVLHLLDGDSVRQGFSDITRWLQPEGKLFVSALTPAGSYWKGFNAEFSRRAKLGDRWPGYIDDVSRYDPNSQPGTGCHLLSEAVLIRELRAAGLEVEELLTYSLAWDVTQSCCAIVARRPRT